MIEFPLLLGPIKRLIPPAPLGSDQTIQGRASPLDILIWLGAYLPPSMANTPPLTYQAYLSEEIRTQPNRVIAAHTTRGIDLLKFDQTHGSMSPMALFHRRLLGRERLSFEWALMTVIVARRAIVMASMAIESAAVSEDIR